MSFGKGEGVIVYTAWQSVGKCKFMERTVYKDLFFVKIYNTPQNLDNNKGAIKRVSLQKI